MILNMTFVKKCRKQQRNIKAIRFICHLSYVFYYSLEKSWFYVHSIYLHIKLINQRIVCQAAKFQYQQCKQMQGILTKCKQSIIFYKNRLKKILNLYKSKMDHLWHFTKMHSSQLLTSTSSALAHRLSSFVSLHLQTNLFDWSIHAQNIFRSTSTYGIVRKIIQYGVRLSKPNSSHSIVLIWSIFSMSKDCINFYMWTGCFNLASGSIWIVFGLRQIVSGFSSDLVLYRQPSIV